MSDVQWQVVEVPILGTDESVDPALVPAGTIVDSLNTEYTTKGGTLRKRPGLDVRCTQAKAQEIGITAGTKLIKYKDQIFVVGSDGKVYTPEPTSLGYSEHISSLPTKTVRRNSIVTELNGMTVGDVACAGQYVVHAFLCVVRNSISVRITDTLSGSVIVNQNLTHPGGANPRWLRAATSGSHVMIVYSDWTGEIYGVVYDCSSTPTEAGSPTLITLPAEKQDTNELTITGGVTSTPRWFIAYVDSNEQGQLHELFSNFTTGWSQVFGDTVSSISCLEHGSYVWYNWRDTTMSATSAVWAFGLNDKDTGALSTATQSWVSGGGIDIPSADANAGAVRSVYVSAISGTSDPEKVIMFSCQDTATSTDNPDSTASDHIIDGVPVLRWRSVNSSFVKGTLQFVHGAQINSYPWRDLGTDNHYMWVAVQARFNPYRRYEAGVPQWATDARTMTLALIKVTESSSQAWLEATACGEIVSYPLTVDVLGNLEGRRAASAQSVSEDGDGYWHTVTNIEPIPREGSIGPYTPLTNPVEVVVRDDHPGRFLSVEFGNSTYIAGGVLTQFDGLSFAENNMICPPILSTQARHTAGAGNWDTDWTNASNEPPIYVGVYETISVYGERTKSPVTYACKGLHAAYGAAYETECIFEPLTVTRRHISGTNDNLTPRVFFALYRTAFTNDESFQRLSPYVNNGLKYFELQPTTGPKKVYDRGSTDINDADPGKGTISNAYAALAANSMTYRIDSSELLYTSSGELENVLPYGGCTGIAVHQDRLWICGGEEPDLIWYSKPRADNRTAEFSLAQQIRIPGRTVVALASMDQLIYAFCEDAVFAIEGSGPNAMGQEGSFSEPYPITLAMGATDPRSVVSTPIGIFFRTQAGMYVIDRGTRIPVWIGQPMSDTFDLYPTVLSAKVVPEKTQVRFALGNDDGGILVVFDWEEQRWTKWQYTCMGFVADMSAWNDHNTAILSTEGGLYEENYSKFLDDTTPYYAYAETGWLSFGSLQGFKRIRKTGLLLEKLGNHGLDVSMWFNYTKTGLSATKSFSSTEISAIQGPEWVRITMPYQKQPSVKLRLTETPYTDPLGDIPESAGFAWKSMAFEIGLMAGIKRLPQGQSK